MSTIVLIVIAAVIVIAGLVWFLARRRRPEHLQLCFGPDEDRQPGRRAYRIRSLTSEERESFAKRWYEVQARSVDDPAGAFREADLLVNMAMQAGGYPMGEFEALAANLFVGHPRVVGNYRAAHAIAVRRERGEATTEDLQHAMVYYHELFEGLLEYQKVG